jgi:DNA-binding transcriptional ArsR family regulator
MDTIARRGCFMSQAALTLQVPGLAKTKLAILRQLAKQSGVTAEKFAKQLIEDGLSVQQKARTTPFDELLGPFRSQFKKSGMTEAELDGIVDAARTRHHKRNKKKRA